MPDQRAPESLRVDDKLEKEFEAALAYELQDDDIERARLLLDVDVAYRTRELLLGRDAGRHPQLGERRRRRQSPLHGRDVRPDDAMGFADRARHHGRSHQDPDAGRPDAQGAEGEDAFLFRGIHVFVSGGTWDWYRPIYPGDRLYAFGGEETLDVKQSEFAGRSVVQVRRDVVINQRGEIVGVYRILRILTERKESRNRGKYADIEPAEYTDDDYERIDAIYAQESPRGAEKRYWEDVEVGDDLPPMVKGPLTVTEMIAFHAGGYGFVPYGLRASRLGYKNRKRIAPFYIKNEHGVWDVAQRLHWDSQWAKAIGNPMAYDYGVMRQCWFFHHVSDWAGDDAFVEKLSDSIRKFNYMGDTQFLSGKVVAKREEDGRHVVDLELSMVSQRDIETAQATATVSLPSRAAGIPPLPPVPVELAAQDVGDVRPSQRAAGRGRRALIPRSRS